jgi:putative oxidoreductase
MNRLYPEFVRGRGAAGLLLVRLVTGAAFVLHGWPKIQSPFGWMGPDAPMPGVLLALAAAAEFFGGLALIAGVLTPVAAFGLAGTMFVAITQYHLPQGHAFVAAPGQPSFELAAAYLANVVMLLLVGPGTLSLDALLFGGRKVAAAERRREAVPVGVSD